MLFQNLCKRSEYFLVFLLKPVLYRAVDVEHTDDVSISVEWNYDFGARCTITGNMSRELMDIGNPLYLICCNGCSADSFSCFNFRAGCLSLERS